MVDATALPEGPTIKGRLSRDDVMMRLGMVIIAIYLIVTMVLPLWAMMSKSLSTFKFDLSGYELQVSDEAGNFDGAIVTPAQLNAELQVLQDSDLGGGSDSRMGLTQFFPDFSFRSPVMYRIRNTTDTGRFLVGSELKTGTEWLELYNTTSQPVRLNGLLVHDGDSGHHEIDRTGRRPYLNRQQQKMRT